MRTARLWRVGLGLGVTAALAVGGCGGRGGAKVAAYHCGSAASGHAGVTAYHINGSGFSCVTLTQAVQAYYAAPMATCLRASRCTQKGMSISIIRCARRHLLVRCTFRVNRKLGRVAFRETALPRS